MRKNLSSDDLITMSKWDEYQNKVFTRECWEGVWCIYFVDTQRKTPETEFEKALFTELNAGQYFIMRGWRKANTIQSYAYEIRDESECNIKDWIEMSVEEWKEYSIARHYEGYETEI